MNSNKDILKGSETSQSTRNCPALRFPGFSDPWTQTTLGEIAEVNPSAMESMPLRFQYIDLESVEKGRIVKCNVLTKEEAPSRAQRILNNGDVIFQMVRPYQQNNLYFNLNSNIPVVASTGYAQLRGFQSSHFLYYAVHTPIFLEEVLNRCTGSNYPAINSADLSAIAVSLPSLGEQRKIAEFLSLIDDRLEVSAKIIKELKTQKTGLQDAIFKQRLRFPDFSDPWTQTTLGEVVRLPEQIEVSSPKLEDILSVKLHGKGIARSNATTLQLGATKYYIRKQGQLIYGKQNFHNGAIALISENYDNGITSKDIPSFDLNRQLVAPLFLLSFLLRTEYYTAMEVYTTGTGSKRLKEDVFFNLPVSFPSLVEQEKIAAFLSLIDERIEVEEKLLRKYEEQKRYLLQQMFV